MAVRLDPASLVDGASLSLQTSAGESFFDVRRLDILDILDICDKYAGSVVILNDVTTHKHALRTAEEANRAKSAFLATMTHELRTPLNGVLGAMHLIRDEGLTDAQNEFADTIGRSGERLLGVIDNVLDYSRIEAGRIEIECTPFSLSEMLGGVLAIVRPRAIESGVRLTLDCSAPGDAHRLGDSRFWFDLDLPPVEASPRRAEETPPLELGEQPARTILMVEDDDVNRVVGKTLLERRGHRVLAVATGTAAIRIVRDDRIDIVRMDIRLPDIDGFEAARRIRTLVREAPHRECFPIIALTAQVEPSDAAACEAAGIDDLVVKPFSPDDLCRRIERLLEGDTATPAADRSIRDGAGDWLDPHTLAEHFNALGPGRTAQILKAFETNTGNTLEALATSGVDRSQLVERAHRLAGSAAALGLPRLRSPAIDLEHAARAGSGELHTLSAQMPAAIDMSHQRLAAYWSSLCEEASASSM